MCGPKFCSMKITQEVRDFVAKQNTDSNLARGNLRDKTSKIETEAALEGMEKMRNRYRKGGDRYIPSAD